jgi:hypothetical protein
MAARKRIKDTNIRALFSRSGNQCAFPGCTNRLITEDNIFVGQICHIEAYSSGGPRFNKSTTDEEKNKYDNLVLLCYEHHKIIDNGDSYDKNTISKFKKNHEAKFSTANFYVDNDVLKKIIIEADLFEATLEYIQKIERKDDLLKFEYDGTLGFLDRIDEIRRSVDLVFSSYNELSNTGDIEALIDLGFDWAMAVLGTHNHFINIEIHLLKLEIEYLMKELSCGNIECEKILAEKRLCLKELVATSSIVD